MRNYIAKTVDEYIMNAPAASHATLMELRAVIKSAVPKAEESIKWGIPFYMYHGMLTGFSVFKNHVSVGMGGPSLNDKDRNMLEKNGYVTGKKIIQIKFNQKIPTIFIKQLLKEQAKTNEIKKAMKSSKKKIK